MIKKIIAHTFCLCPFIRCQLKCTTNLKHHDRQVIRSSQVATFCFVKTYLQGLTIFNNVISKHAIFSILKFAIKPPLHIPYIAQLRWHILVSTMYLFYYTHFATYSRIALLAPQSPFRLWASLKWIFGVLSLFHNVRACVSLWADWAVTVFDSIHVTI